MKKNYIFILLFFAIYLSCFGISNIVSNSGINVESFSADIKIDANGDMLVEEQRTVTYPSGYSVTFRDIAYNKYNPQNPLYQERTNRAYFELEDVWVAKNNQRLSPSSYEVKLTGEYDELGEIIACPASNYQCDSVFIRVPSGFGSQMTFGYRYKIKGAVTEYLDIAELNWLLLGGENFVLDSNIDKVNITITLPNIPNEEILAWAHGTSGEVIIEDNKVILDVKNMKKSESLEFRILMPREYFAVPEINMVSRTMKQEIIDYQNDLAKETNQRIMIAKMVFYGTFGMLALMLIFAYIAYLKYDKEHKPKFQGKYYRELPANYSPAEMSYLYYFKKINDEDLTATLLDLIRRKYLIFDQNLQGINDKDPNFKFVLNPELSQEDLKAHEKHLLNWFIKVIGDKKEVTLQQIEDYPKKSYQNAVRFKEDSKEFVRRVKAEGSKHDFFEKSLGPEKSKMYFASMIPIIYIILSLILRGIYYIDVKFSLFISFLVLILYVFYISSIKKRSINGNEDYVKWKAFRDFLLDFGNMKDYPIPGIVVWEHYLVYATSLKVADKVMSQLEVKLPKTVEDYELSGATYLGFAYHYPRFHFWYTFNRINTSISFARQNQQQTIVRHNTQKVGGSGGFGRGGGFGGGSSFGGGGGGFRSR